MSNNLLIGLLQYCGCWMVSESLYTLQLVHILQPESLLSLRTPNCLPRLLQSQESRPLINTKYICCWKTILLQNSLVTERPPTTCRNQTFPILSTHIHSQNWIT